MAIKEYSRARDGEKKLSPSFRVREFACNDGSDPVMIDEELVVVLQCIREHFGKPLHITSGYRTGSYNARPDVNGSKTSQHLLGTGGRLLGGGGNDRRRGGLRREAAAGAGRHWTLPQGQSPPQAENRLGACGHPTEKEQMDIIKEKRTMKNQVCTIIGIVGGAIATAFGGWDTALAALVTFMAIDYITGLMVAGIFHTSRKTESGALESLAGWKGLCRKGVTLLVVLVACQLDKVMGSSFIRDAAIIGFMANEAISIIENAGLMGVPIPEVITQAVDVLRKKGKEE